MQSHGVDALVENKIIITVDRYFYYSITGRLSDRLTVILKCLLKLIFLISNFIVSLKLRAGQVYTNT